MSIIWETNLSPASASKVFDELINAWSKEEKKVFVIRGTGLGPDPKDFYDKNFNLIGTPAALGEDVKVGDRSAQRSGQIWMEVRYDPKHPDAYRHSANAQPFHTDGAYIPSFPNATLMACVANAGIGGETTFIDGDVLVQCLKTENPDLYKRLCARNVRHARSGDERDEKIIDFIDGKVELNWNYYCVAKDIDAEGKEIAEDFFKFLQTSPGVKAATQAVKLQPGDAVTWKDRRVLHGRNGFVANQESERFLWKCAVDVGNFGSKN